MWPSSLRPRRSRWAKTRRRRGRSSRRATCMPDRARGPNGRSPRANPQDQAAGLRRLFAPPESQWLPILLASGRETGDTRWLARFAGAWAEQGARTLVVDAARAQLGAAFGLRIRYDL